MRQIFSSVVVAAALSAAPLSAHAQSLGKQGDLSVAAERLSGLSMGSIGVDPEGPIDEIDYDYVSFRLLTTDTVGSGLLAAAVPVFSTPRIGIDYFVAESVSVGGSVGFATTSWDDEGGNDSSATTFLLALRAGYWIPLNTSFAFWPRGGLTIVSTSQGDEDENDVSTTLPALSLEAPLMISLGPAFLELAAALDVSLGGSGETRNAGDVDSEFDVSVFELGLHAGLGIVF